MTAQPWAGQWAYLVNEGLITPKKSGAGKVATQFAAAFGRQSGAPIRLAFRLNDDVKKQIKAAGNDPSMGMVAALLDPLMNLDTGTLGITLGEAPKLSFDLNFADADSAMQFKQGMDTLSGFATMFIQQQQAAAAQNDPNAKKLTPQQLKATLAPLTLKQSESTLSTQLDTQFLKNLKDLGVLNSLPIGGPGGPPPGISDPSDTDVPPARPGPTPKGASKRAPAKPDADSGD